MTYEDELLGRALALWRKEDKELERRARRMLVDAAYAIDPAGPPGLDRHERKAMYDRLTVELVASRKRRKKGA